MKNEEILKKAIEKAVKNGWDITTLGYGPMSIGNGIKEIKPMGNYRKDKDKWFEVIFEAGGIVLHINTLIFNNDFAKAFWGEDPPVGYFNITLKQWQYHLQQMVLEGDPISYLAGFI